MPPDQVLWVEAAVHSEAPCEIRPEHPTPKLVTDNLDNFSNRGDRHRLSISSTPQDKATLTLSLDPVGSLYSLAPLVLVAIPAPSGGPEDVEVVEQSLKTFVTLHNTPALTLVATVVK